MLLESNRCPDAVPFLKAAIAAKVPTADAYLGLALCQAAARRLDDAQATLREAERVEPDNPVVLANLGIVLSDAGKFRDAIPSFQRALTLDPNFHEARFNLARGVRARRAAARTPRAKRRSCSHAFRPTRRSVRKCSDCWMQCGEQRDGTESDGGQRVIAGVKVSRVSTIRVQSACAQDVEMQDRDPAMHWTRLATRLESSVRLPYESLRASVVNPVISVISRDNDPHLSLTAVRHFTRPTKRLLSRWIHRIG